MLLHVLWTCAVVVLGSLIIWLVSNFAKWFYIGECTGTSLEGLESLVT